MKTATNTALKRKFNDILQLRSDLLDPATVIRTGEWSRRTCEFNHEDRLNTTVACPRPDESCVPGELFGFDFDSCRETPTTLEEGAFCEDAGLQQGELCGVNSLCVIYMGSRPRCRDMCFVTEAPFGSSNHPDCRNPEDVCVEAFNNDQTGICETLPGG